MTTKEEKIKHFQELTGSKAEKALKEINKIRLGNGESCLTFAEAEEFIDRVYFNADGDLEEFVYYL